MASSTDFLKGNCPTPNLTSRTVAALAFCVETNTFPPRPVKHTCPFSPTHLIAVGTLINSHAVRPSVRHRRGPNADALMSLDRQRWLCQHFSTQGSRILDLYEFGQQFTERLAEYNR